GKNKVPIKTKVTDIETFKKSCDESRAGDNSGLLLRGVKREDVHALVHGDFTMPAIRSAGAWPPVKHGSTRGPYGQTGTYGKEESWDAVGEQEYLTAVRKGWVQL
ncbi:translation elongation factor Tu, partial [Teratosphaeria destructans]